MSDRAPECEHVIIEDRGDLAVVTLNRPHVFNTLSVETLDELTQGFRWLARRSHVRAVILSGRGGEAFAAGADIREVTALEGLRALPFARRGQQLCRLIEQGPRCIIAAIDGYCMGGGLDLALACHLRVASARSTFAHPGGRIGIMTGFGGTQRLPHLIGRSRAAEVFLTGRRLTAAEAYTLGLVNRVVHDGAAFKVAEALARRVIRSSLVDSRPAFV